VSLDLSIIIVNWKSSEFVRECVNSICQQTAELSYEIIVIDNASFDGCDEVLRKDHPEVTYIQSQNNLGFAKANNQAFAAARGASLLFLNPDTKIIGPAILRLHEALNKLPKAGAVGARLLNGDGSLQTSCIQAFPTLMNQVLDSAFLRHLWPKLGLWGMAPLFCPGGTPQEVDMISGACLMVQRSVFEDIGGFSEEYAMYVEDADLCMKAQSAGWKNYYVPEANVIHFGGNSSQQAGSNFSAVMIRESIWQFLCKSRGKFYGFSALCRLGVIGVLLIFQPLFRRHSWIGSFRKWMAILRWSLKRDTVRMPQPLAGWRSDGGRALVARQQ
jgi:GT2 family glycosyltransferase